MAKKKTTATTSGVSVGGDLNATAGRDVNVAGGDITTGGLVFDQDWRESAMSALGKSEVNPRDRGHIERSMDEIEKELEKDDPDISLMKTLAGGIELIAPIVSSAIRVALPFLQ